MQHRLKIALAAALLGCMAAPVCFAQSMDHAGLREVFGEPVTTSANGSPQKESEVPLNMEIVTQDEIKRMGARSIPEVLRFLPGFTVRQIGFGQTEVSIRGYNTPSAERILVLVDGRQVYRDYFGQVNWDAIPVEIGDIVQIEVVRGPNTALFGFNAVSGVINIITHNPLYSDVGEVRVSAGNQNFVEASGVKSVKFTDKIAVKLSGGSYGADEFGDMEGAIPLAQELENDRRSIDGDLWVQVAEGVQVHMEATRTTNDRNEFIVTRSPGHIEHDASSVRGRVIADTGIGLIEADVYHNEAQNNFNLLTSTGTYSDLSIDNRVTVARLSDTFQLGAAHTFRVGGEYRDASNIILPADGLNDLHSTVKTASGLWDWKVNDKLSTSAAVRYDYFELEREGNPPIFNPFFTQDDYDQVREEVSYNFGAVYKATDIDTFRLTAARGADLPSFVEFGLQFFLAGQDGIVFPGFPANPVNFDNSTLLGDPRTETSIVHNFELGYNRAIESINGMMKTAVFYQYNDEMQAFGAAFSADPTAFGSPASFLTNIGDSEAYGFEIGFDGVFREKWDWFANYSYIDINDDLRNFGNNSDDPNAFNSAAEFEESVVNHTLSAHLGYKDEKWYAGVYAQYLSDFTDLIATSTPNLFTEVDVNDTFIANAGFSYYLNDNLTWSLAGTNVVGQTQQLGEVDAERQIWTSLTVDFD